jgi:hypothetical protein
MDRNSVVAALLNLEHALDYAAAAPRHGPAYCGSQTPGRESPSLVLLSY